MTDRPAIPPAREIDPLVETLAAGTELARVYHRDQGSISFNAPSTSGRFRPVMASDRTVVATAYLAADDETALAEGVLRGVTALQDALPRRLYRTQVEGLALCHLTLTSDLRVARLHGPGLQRLGLLRAHVIDCDESDYPYTAKWAQALWGCPRRPAGISWTSRQNDSAPAYMLWGNRVRESAIALERPGIALDHGPGRNLIREACVTTGVDFEG